MSGLLPRAAWQRSAPVKQDKNRKPFCCSTWTYGSKRPLLSRLFQTPDQEPLTARNDARCTTCGDLPALGRKVDFKLLHIPRRARSRTSNYLDARGVGQEATGLNHNVYFARTAQRKRQRDVSEASRSS